MFPHVDKISNLEKELDTTAHEALEDLLTQVGVTLPESAEAYTTADAQGIIFMAYSQHYYLSRCNLCN